MLIVDRFEGEFAVLEGEAGMLTVPRSSLPSEAREGDAVAALPDGRYRLDAQRSEERKKDLSELFQRLKKK